MKSIGDSILSAIIAFLVRVSFWPKVFFVDKEQQDLKLKEPSILVCNHRSHLDGPVLNTVFRNESIHSLAAKDRFEQKTFGFFLRHTNCIPIDRQKADTSWIYQSLQVLNVQKENIAIYPEGRHAEPRKLLPFHSGVSLLAVMAKAPIVMVYMDSPHRFGRRTKLLVAPPYRIEIPTTGITADFAEEQTKLLQKKMEDLMNQFYSKIENS